MRKLLTILCCAMCAITAQAQQKWAVVVGISDYAEESGWSKISGANDIELIVPVLHRVGIKPENITTLRDTEATKENIRNALLSLTERASEGDMVYFHFSGHGQQITDINGDEQREDELDFWDESIVPYDARIDNAGGYDGEKHIVTYNGECKIVNTTKSATDVEVTLDHCYAVYYGDMYTPGTADNFYFFIRNIVFTICKDEFISKSFVVLLFCNLLDSQKIICIIIFLFMHLIFFCICMRLAFIFKHRNKCHKEYFYIKP